MSLQTRENNAYENQIVVQLSIPEYKWWKQCTKHHFSRMAPWRKSQCVLKISELSEKQLIEKMTNF